MPEDGGEYKCIAENAAGKAECACKVLVEGKFFAGYGKTFLRTSSFPPSFSNSSLYEPHTQKRTLLHSFWSISNSVSTINEHEQRDSTEPRALAALWNNLCCPAAHLQGF